MTLGRKKDGSAYYDAEEPLSIPREVIEREHILISDYADGIQYIQFVCDNGNHYESTGVIYVSELDPDTASIAVIIAKLQRMLRRRLVVALGKNKKGSE